ncbi:hypothetical protein ES703_76034 [subsurface metagenome]
MADRITLSPSRVKRWVRCKKTYYWRYNRKLVRIRKEAPMSLGLVIGGALAEYYKLQPDERSFEVLTSTCLGKSIKSNLPEVQGEKSKGREKIIRTSGLLLAHYHDWAIEKDDFDVVMVETSHQVELTPEISLLAIPDANVVTPEEMPLILEHKVRYRYRPGDFGIDYQSVASCIVSDAIGTLYNVLEYGKGKYHREPIIRSEQELDYFKDMFIHIGQDILSSPPERMYPMPFKRCSCEYWELCNGEMQGLDLDDIIKELYQPSSGRKGKMEGGEIG